MSLDGRRPDGKWSPGGWGEAAPAALHLLSYLSVLTEGTEL